MMEVRLERTFVALQKEHWMVEILGLIILTRQRCVVTFVHAAGHYFVSGCALNIYFYCFC